MVSCFGIFREEGVGAGDDDEDKEDESEDGVDDEPDYAEDAVCEAREVEDVGEEDHEEHVEGVDCGDGDGETVGLFVHIRTDPAHESEEDNFDDENGNDLGY